MNCFATIITADYFFYAKTIIDALVTYDKNIRLQVLVVGDVPESTQYENVKIHTLKEIATCFQDDYETIKHYEIDAASTLRWALKPLFLKYLLLQEGFSKAVLIDPDIYFYNSPLFLFDYLEDVDVLITPHWRSKDPKKDASNFNELFTGGLYNAGFFACNASAINILDWWLAACAYKMEKTGGFYVDQSYLNLLPIYFSNQVKVLQHRGCNVANWNLIECERTNNTGEVLINDTYPIVFIHLTNSTINGINRGVDSLLKPHLEHYKKALVKHNPSFKFTFETYANTTQNVKSFRERIKNLLKF
ncbi:MAG: hypothetical protein NWQ19_11955 [Nonlabens sp.]|nr:hypothetical protein [Nonlabens sp.]